MSAADPVQNADRSPNGTQSPQPARSEKPSAVRGLLRQLPFFLWLVLVWMVVWGQWTPLAALTGAIVAIIVLRVFYLPPAETPTRVNLYGLGVVIVTFVWDLALSSFQVAWQAIRPQPIGPSSIIQVDLRTRSDLILTLTALAVTLVPGSYALEVDRETTTLYLHVLGASTVEEIEAMRRRVLHEEEQFIRAIGSRSDLLRLQRWHEAERDGDGRTTVKPRREPE